MKSVSLSESDDDNDGVDLNSKRQEMQNSDSDDDSDNVMAASDISPYASPVLSKKASFQINDNPPVFTPSVATAPKILSETIIKAKKENFEKFFKADGFINKLSAMCEDTHSIKIGDYVKENKDVLDTYIRWQNQLRFAPQKSPKKKSKPSEYIELSRNGLNKWLDAVEYGNNNRKELFKSPIKFEKWYTGNSEVYSLLYLQSLKLFVKIYTQGLTGNILRPRKKMAELLKISIDDKIPFNVSVPKLCINKKFLEFFQIFKDSMSEN